MKKLGKTLRQKDYIDKATEAVKNGATPDAALKEAKQGLYETGTALAPMVRKELGLDDEETKETFGKIVAGEFLRAHTGQFPQWIEDVPDEANRGKLKMDYLKTYKHTLSDAVITKKEKHIHEEGEFAGRTNEEIQYFATHGVWPEDRTIDA